MPYVVNPWGNIWRFVIFRDQFKYSPTRLYLEFLLRANYYYYYFRMLAQSCTPNLYTPPLHHNFFIILSPLFFATVSIPIRFEPCIHPPVEWEHIETKTFTRKTSQPIGNLFCLPRPWLKRIQKKKGLKLTEYFVKKLSRKWKVSWRITFCVVYLDFICIYSQRRCMHACCARNRQG